jgi:hypothetical protein
MHNNAPNYAYKSTIKELESRRIRILIWPPFSPGLNPIETV